MFLDFASHLESFPRFPVLAHRLSKDNVVNTHYFMAYHVFFTRVSTFSINHLDNLYMIFL